MLSRADATAASNYLEQRTTLLKSSTGNAFYRPSRMSLGLGDRCNRSCPNCFAGASTGGTNIMDKMVYRKAITEAREAHVPSLVLTGGETSQYKEHLEEAIREARRFGVLGLSVQTNTIMSESQRDDLFAQVRTEGWDVPGDRAFQFNVSYHLDRTAEETEQFKSFVSDFFGSFRNARLIIEFMIDRHPDDFNAELRTRLYDFLCRYQEHAANQRMSLNYAFPLMIGRAAALRGSEFADIIRRECGEIDFRAYRYFEDPQEDLLGVDPLGFVYPCGTFMYLGVYPIGNIYHSSLSQIITEAQTDPVLRLVGLGRGKELYELACRLYPDFNGLLGLLADPLEVMVDILSDREKALSIMKEALKIV